MQRDRVVAAGHEVNARVLHDALREWGVANVRRFPWRETYDPYRILMAEVMLHRTQARQVVLVYKQFITRYPNVAALAQSSPGDLHQILFSLGLRWRIDLMQSMARELMARYGGCVPRAKSELETLPGVSDYIASAVRCFAWNEAEPLIDTNTVRVVGRLFGLPTNAESRRKRGVRQILLHLLDRRDPRGYNFRLLDLAAMICTPGDPQCPACPLQTFCLTGQRRTQKT